MELAREELIMKARALADELEQTHLLRRQFLERTDVSEHQVLKVFGSWTNFFQSAGLEPQATTRYDDEDLLRAARTAFLEAGRIPTLREFEKLVPHGWATYRRRWRTWPAFLAAFRDWVIEDDPSFPHLSQLDEAKPDSDNPNVAAVVTRAGSRVGWDASGGRRFGRFLNFRGLQHAPINEQGVVFLFGMVASELGYAVESVATGFPDCEGKRRIKGSSETWERVRIEFEYQSRNFRDHGHDPNECELIVCWEHNWPECPIEVLELRSAITHLDDEA